MLHPQLAGSRRVSVPVCPISGERLVFSINPLLSLRKLSFARQLGHIRIIVPGL
jgi:hypothetical protein